jgi:tetratricopeptide (TPR) repeat protein
MFVNCMSPSLRSAMWALLFALLVRSAEAQCPDGTPPPCARGATQPAATSPPPTERDRARTFLVLPFRNLSRIAEYQWLVEASPTMLADALGQWTEVTVVPDERLYPALRRHGLQPGSVMDLVSLRRVAAETGGWTAVTGEVIVVGDRLQVSARAYDLVTQRLVTRTTFEGRATDDVRDAYEHIATALLRAAGLEQASADLAAATTSSLDAYRAYLRGMAHLNRAEYRQARDAMVEAVRIDSTFAQAYAKLAEVSLLAFSVLDPDHPAYGYAERAAALSNRLPPRAASHVRALRSLLNADFTAARLELGGLVAQDSNDVDALEDLASLEFLDPLLVAAPAGERRRGSLNAATRLSRRVLDLDPTRHGAYQGLVVIYSLAAGQPPGAVAGYRRELPRPVRSSVRAWCSCDFELGSAGQAPGRGSDSALAPQFAGPDLMLVPLLHDSLELVPVDSLAAIPAESLAASRARARTAARAWARRWLVAGPAEAEAHRMMGRVLELDGNYEAALRELDIADSLGVEAEAEAVAARRMILLGKLGRLDDARRIADSLFQASYFGGELFATVPAMTEAYAWATNLFAAAGDFERVRAALAAFSARLTLRLEPARAYAATVAVLSGSESGQAAHVVLPDGLRLTVREALRAEQIRNPGDPLLGAWLRSLSAAFPNR